MTWRCGNCVEVTHLDNSHQRDFHLLRGYRSTPRMGSGSGGNTSSHTQAATSHGHYVRTPTKSLPPSPSSQPATSHTQAQGRGPSTPVCLQVLVRPGLAGNGPGVSPVCKTRRGRGSPAPCRCNTLRREYLGLFPGRRTPAVNSLALTFPSLSDWQRGVVVVAVKSTVPFT